MNVIIIHLSPPKQTRGLKHGRAIVVSTCAAVASIVTGVLAGMFALGERLPSAPGARVTLLLGWYISIISGRKYSRILFIYLFIPGDLIVQAIYHSWCDSSGNFFTSGETSPEVTETFCITKWWWCGEKLWAQANGFNQNKRFESERSYPNKYSASFDIVLFKRESLSF